MDAFSFIVCFLLFQGRPSYNDSIGDPLYYFQSVTVVLGEQYDVTVITDPPSGPFLIRNQINFTCYVHPMPPEPVTYSWHAVKDANGPTTLSRQKNTLYTPFHRDLHFSWFFCKVFSNESLTGIGRRLVEIHGKTVHASLPMCVLLNNLLWLHYRFCIQFENVISHFHSRQYH